MSEPDPPYFKGALETLDLIQELLNHRDQTQTLDKFVEDLSAIEAKASVRVGTDLSRSLEIDLPVKDTENKGTPFWQGVRDMAQVLVKYWTQSGQEVSTFQSKLYKMRERLKGKIPVDDFNPLEDLIQDNDKDPSSATPYVYYPPYPKPPPQGMAEAHEKPKTPVIVDPPEYILPRKELPKEGSKPLIDEIIDEEDEEILTESLKDALRILRDEDEISEDG